MAFQFLCPHGHLLEGDESQQGQPCDCPTCGTRFLIPRLQSAPAPGPQSEPQPDAAPEFHFGPGGGDVSAAAPMVEGPKLLHIPCPNGHELETPEDMLGQDVICPLCGEQFNLRYKDSLEAKRAEELEQERKERRLAKAWFNRAIIAAVVVVLSLIGMAIITSSN